MDKLKKYAVEMIAKHPKHKNDIIELYSLAQDEIADGGSEEHEVQLAMSDIAELVGEIL